MAGRPRDAELERRLIDATWSLLQSRGYTGLTLSDVASEAKAHRTDVYRRWSSKAALVADVLAIHIPPARDVDTGSLLSDLRAFLDDLAAAWAQPWANGIAGFLADVRSDPHAEEKLRAMSVNRSQPLVNAVARAVRRGEISQVPEPSLLGNLLEGPLLHRRLFTGEPFAPEDLDVIAASAHLLLTSSAVRS